MLSIAKWIENIKGCTANSRGFILHAAAILFIASQAASLQAQPGPLQNISFPLQPGTLTVPGYTPLAIAYYPYWNGLPNDSTRCVFGDQLISGTASTADRIIDVTVAGAFAYRNSSGVWTGALVRLVYGHAFIIANRHAADTVTIAGFPADSVTYIMPMPTGSIRFAAARMSVEKSVSSMGFTWSGFHWSESLRRGGDLIIDMTTRKIARRDSLSGWIGTLSIVRPGEPLLIQVNHPATFDWSYNPNRE
jgi:hypothetical protein